MLNYGMLFFLLAIYQIKHFLCDYPLQTKYMLGKFRPDWGFLKPLLAHAGVHGAFTTVIALLVKPELWWLGLIDMGIHFTMDRLKAGPKYLGRFKSLAASEYVGASAQKLRENTYFWWALGLDQMIHHLTHYFIIWELIK